MAIDFGVLPPEINSGRMYSGPGSGSMLAAAAAWDRLATHLRATAEAYSSVISGLTVDWQGPSASAMTGAAKPYSAWMNATAAQAEQTAAQARAAAAAYETAFVATVPPPVVTANRAALESLLATNTFGQNTPAIAATEAQYGDMWAQDAAAMYGYASQSATASQLTPFTPPAQTTNPDGAAAQSATVAQTAGTSAGTSARSMLSQLASQPLPSSLQSLAAPAAADPSSLPSSLASLNTTPLGTALRLFEFSSPASLPGRNALVSSTLGYGLATRGFTTGELPVPLVPGVLYPPLVGPAGVGSAISADMARAGVVGALSVPPSWAAATPAVRLAATVLQGTSPAAAPLIEAASQGGMLGQMALASLAGSALGGSVPRAAMRTGARNENSSSGTDSSGDGQDTKTSEKLKRVLAELSQKPDSVQHWHTDKANLDSLLEQLSTQPGVHAVHVSARHKPNPAPPKPRWG